MVLPQEQFEECVDWPSVPYDTSGTVIPGGRHPRFMRWPEAEFKK